MYSIYDTREPEGNGGPITNRDGEALTFDTHAAAENHCMLAGIDVTRVVIAGSPEPE